MLIDFCHALFFFFLNFIIFLLLFIRFEIKNDISGQGYRRASEFSKGMKVTHNLHKGIRVKNTEGQNGLCPSPFNTVSLNSVQTNMEVIKSLGRGIHVRLNFLGICR